MRDIHAIAFETYSTATSINAIDRSYLPVIKSNTFRDETYPFHSRGYCVLLGLQCSA
jgi:hypothetical protein